MEQSRMNEELTKLLEQCQTLNARVQTNDAKDILLRLIRLVEILIDGKPKTPLRPTRHV
jgi:hypothetical protein